MSRWYRALHATRGRPRAGRDGEKRKEEVDVGESGFESLSLWLWEARRAPKGLLTTTHFGEESFQSLFSLSEANSDSDVKTFLET